MHAYIIEMKTTTQKCTAVNICTCAPVPQARSGTLTFFPREDVSKITNKRRPRKNATPNQIGVYSRIIRKKITSMVQLGNLQLRFYLRKKSETLELYTCLFYIIFTNDLP